MAEPLVPLNVMVTPDQKTWLESRAIEQERSVSWSLRQLIELAQLGESLAVQLADGAPTTDLVGQIIPGIEATQNRPEIDVFHTHAKARRNAAHLDVCACGAVKGTNGTWRT